MIEVNADEAQARQLPRIGFRVDATGTSLSLGKFPDADKYLIASGPPGGPLLAIVWRAEEREDDLAAVERVVRRRYARPRDQLVVGEAGTITLGGVERPALAFTTGQGRGRIGWCGVMATGAHASALVAFGRGVREGATLSCAEVVAEPSLAAFARTFTLLA
jgi:hypothetical protein